MITENSRRRMWLDEMSKPHFSFRLNKRSPLLIRWLEENCVGEYICEYRIVIFTCEADAILYKLKF